MPRPRDRDEEEYEDDDRPLEEGEDLPEGVYLDEDDDPAVPCPHCGHPVYEGASFCVKCENFISREGGLADRKPAWVWVCLALALAAAAWWALAG